MSIYIKDIYLQNLTNMKAERKNSINSIGEVCVGGTSEAKLLLQKILLLVRKYI